MDDDPAKTNKLNYLASPYSHPDHAVMEERYQATCRFMITTIERGLVFYSPIVHNHPLAKDGGVDTTWETWRNIDLTMLGHCDQLFVLQLDGWEDSVGVKAEIEYARAKHMAVYFIKEDGLDNEFKTPSKDKFFSV